MKPPRSSRDLVKKWHRRDKATLDHLMRSFGDAKPTAPTGHSPFTSSGLAVEDQVRKAWLPNGGGIPVF